ncbi:hypothetical protein [Viscerimonas tarda]
MKKKSIIIMLSLFAGICLMSSCEDMMDTDSDRLMFEDEHTLSSANDSLYSVLGILRKVQTVVDQYVVLGEMRADLVDVTEYTEVGLRDLANFNVKDDNPYLNIRNYYNIINNCNYFLANLDTTIRVSRRPVMLNEYATVKTIRAWVYLQLALNFKEVPYYTEPLVSVTDTEKKFPLYNLEQMTDALIADLEPLRNYGTPNYGNIYGYASSSLFFPIKMALGDLYLWRGKEGDFDRSATYYYELIAQRNYIAQNFSVKYTNTSFKNTSNSWSSIFDDVNNLFELITLIPLPESDESINLYALFTSVTPQIVPSEGIRRISEAQRYAYGTIPTYTTGDLRLQAALRTTRYYDGGTMRQFEFINKFSSNSATVYRVGALYLRLAEAANRAGYPAFAFAALKQGLNPTSYAQLPNHEKEDRKPYMQFNNELFAQNIGIHSRGSGETNINAQYVLPATLETKSDSILYVEDLICTELALETAFEGNRFYDLMRMAIHRDDPSFLAEKVAERTGIRNSQLYNKLTNPANWFLPILDR